MCTVCDELTAELVDILQSLNTADEMDAAFDKFQKDKELSDTEMVRFSARAGEEVGLLSPTEAGVAMLMSWQVEAHIAALGSESKRDSKGT